MIIRVFCISILTRPDTICTHINGSLSISELWIGPKVIITMYQQLKEAPILRLLNKDTTLLTAMYYMCSQNPVIWHAACSSYEPPLLTYEMHELRMQTQQDTQLRHPGVKGTCGRGENPLVQ